MAAHNQPPRRNDDALMWGLLALIVCVGCWAAWHFMHDQIVYHTLRIAWSLLGFFEFGPLTSPIQGLRVELAQAASYASYIDLLEFLRLSAKGFIIFSPLAIALIVFEFIKTLSDPSDSTRRAMSLDKLRRIMSQHSTATIPLDGYPNLLTHNPDDQASSLSPLEFAKKNNLIIKRQLNKKRATEIFRQQLGNRLSSIEDLSPPQRTLFVVFASRLLADRSEAQEWLDLLNRSCKSSGYPDLTLTDKRFAELSKNPKVTEWLSKHLFAPTLLYSLHKEALAFGKLPSSYFRWLKGLDRTLWYTLNNTGRKVPWVECGAVFVQADWEAFAIRHGGRMTDAHVSPGVDGLESWLHNVGAIIKPMSETN